MSGDRFFLDTNIVLYLLNGDETLAMFLNRKHLYISIISELELLGYSGLTQKEEAVIRDFLSECKVLPISSKIKEATVQLRKKYKLKLPDSIIAASCLYLNIPMISADQDFAKIDELTFIHYKNNS